MPTFEMPAWPLGFGSVTGTTNGSVVGVESGPAFDRVLIDDEDTTYIRIVGGLGDDQSWLTSFGSTEKDVQADSWLLMPTNSTGVTVALRARVRTAQTGCVSDDAFVEVYGDDHFYSNLTLPSDSTPPGDFSWVSVDLPTWTNGDPWTPTLVFSALASYGFRARTQCDTSVVQMGVDWSEAALEIGFDLPAPTLTPLLPPHSNLPYKVILRGILNPNQQSLSSPPFNVAAYPLEYGFSVGVNPMALPAITYTGTVEGGGTSNSLILSAPLDVLPGLIHYYRIGARDQDGNETLSTVASFQTPLTDPPQGVY